MKKSALLVIDMQVGASQMKNPAFYQMDALIERLKGVIRKARENSTPVFYAQHHNPDGFPAFGSADWQFIPEIGPTQADTVIRKTTPDVFLSTEFQEQLERQQIRRLIIGGIQTADCIDTTCRRAFGLGYEVVLIKDGHTTFDSPILKAEQIIAHHNQVIANWFGKVIEADKIEW